MKRFVVVLFFVMPLMCEAQFDFNSYWKMWNDHTAGEQGRLDAIRKIEKYYFKTRPDSAIHYCMVEKIYCENTGNTGRLAGVFENIGVGYYFLAKYDSTLYYFGLARKIYEENSDSLGIAKSMNDIGNIHFVRGDYSKALLSYDQSLLIGQRFATKEQIANNHSNIGSVYLKLYNLDKAMIHYQVAESLYSDLGNTFQLAKMKSSFATIYYEKKEIDKAIENYRQVLEYYEKTGEMTSMPSVLSNMSNAYCDDGRYDKALECSEQSLKICIDLGDDFNEVAAWNNAGKQYRLLGDYRKSVDYTLTGLRKSEEIGAVQTARILALNTFFGYQTLNKMDSAEFYLRTLISYRLEDIRINMAIMSESEKELYFSKAFSDIMDLCAFCVERQNTDASVNALAFDMLLQSKGHLIKSSTAMRNSILASDDSSLVSKYNAWIEIKKEIARKYAEGLDVTSLEQTAHELEKSLVIGSKEFSDEDEIQRLTWTNVRDRLLPNQAAVEFVRVNPYNHIKDERFPPYYLAFILTEKSVHPEVVKLAAEKDLESILGKFPGNNVSYINQVYGTKNNLRTDLYNFVWAPMEKSLKGIQSVIVSPDGILHKISFPALARSHEVLLCDLYEIETQTSTGNSEVSTSHRQFKNEGNESESVVTTLFGGIEYNPDVVLAEHGRHDVWQYLHGSMGEVQEIERILGTGKCVVQNYNRVHATEEQFKKSALHSDILHIATHGFFFPDPGEVAAQSATEPETDLTFRNGVSLKGSNYYGVQVFVKNKNPLMRSGLVFAGANDVWNRTTSADDPIADGFENTDSTYREDGVLTAAEVATIDMRKTQLVVLSACETGLGDIKGSEGVYGLQRAFKMAGVRYIIMSLWQVPDKETAEFMTTFYKNLTKTNDIRKSFNLTQQTMRKKYDPYYWAAFVLVE